MSQKKETSLSAAEVLVKCLENEGVQYIFGIPGEENLDVMNALNFQRSNLSLYAMSRGQPLWQTYMED